MGKNIWIITEDILTWMDSKFQGALVTQTKSINSK